MALVGCYIRSVAEFAQHFNQPPRHLSPEEIRAWQLFLLQEKRIISPPTSNRSWGRAYRGRGTSTRPEE